MMRHNEAHNLKKIFLEAIFHVISPEWKFKIGISENHHFLAFKMLFQDIFIKATKRFSQSFKL